MFRRQYLVRLFKHLHSIRHMDCIRQRAKNTNDDWTLDALIQYSASYVISIMIYKIYIWYLKYHTGWFYNWHPPENVFKLATQICFDWYPKFLFWNHIYFAKHLDVSRSWGMSVWNSNFFLKCKCITLYKSTQVV